MTETVSTAPPIDLAALFGFSVDDLAANRAGRLSAAQLNRLRARQRRAALVVGGLVWFGALAATAFLFVGRREDNLILTLIGIAITICCAAASAVFARYGLRLNADIRAGQADTFSGALERVIKPINRRVVMYLIRVGGAEVVVGKDAFKAFQHGAPYRLYRAHYSGVLLAVEQIDAPAH